MIGKIEGGYGMNDYYKFFCERNPDVNIDKKKFNKIVSQFNKEIADSIIEDLEFQMPMKMGKLEMLKQERKPYINKDGVLINNTPIDWKRTKKLWEADKDAKEKKVLIRYNNNHTNNYVFRIFYNKKKAHYKNKSVYFFKPVRSLSRSIAKRIMDYSREKYDTYIKNHKRHV